MNDVYCSHMTTVHRPQPEMNMHIRATVTWRQYLLVRLQVCRSQIRR